MEAKLREDQVVNIDQWLYQRINGNTVNGKPASFKQEEIIKLNKAFKDISKKIGAVSVSLTE